MNSVQEPLLMHLSYAWRRRGAEPIGQVLVYKKGEKELRARSPTGNERTHQQGLTVGY
jgi:hypothetical protein